MGMGRRRSKNREGWPANVYPCKNGYKYRHPISRKDKWMGTDQGAVFAAARKLNAMLVPRNDLVAQVLGEGNTVRDAIKVFRKDDMPHRGWAKKTAYDYDVKLRKIEKEIGGADLAGYSVKDAATYLATATDSPRARQQYRMVLIWLFDAAMQEGWVESNPFSVTRRGTAKRQRDRLTLDGYNAIHAKAPQWLRNAMDLSMLTLLRREDILSLRFTDMHDSALWVMPGKTENSTGVRLKIGVTPELDELLKRCRDDVASPFLVHRLPEKARPREMRAKDREHHTQVLPTQLSRAFADVRDELERFAGVEHPPTFHEIRSLGAALLKEKGWTLDQVQALLAHASGEMTELYLGGHQKPWTEVTPGLSSADLGRK